jgi:hypothetical protein
VYRSLNNYANNKGNNFIPLSYVGCKDFGGSKLQVGKPQIIKEKGV